MYRNHYLNWEKVYWIVSMWIIYSDFFQFFPVAWLISLVFVMYLVTLFWHSNDVFIRAHMETIEKFKKILFQIMDMLLTLILRWKHCYSGLASISKMWCGIYEDAMKEYGLSPNNEIITFEGVENEIIRTKTILLHRVLLYRTVSWISMLAPNASVITVRLRLTI